MPGVLVADLQRPPSRPWAIAHRGASARAPENTMPAFEAAWATGCAWIEADVQPTSDNVPMMLHDADLSRTTNGTGGIRARSAREVSELDAGSWWDTSGSYDRTPVPLLSEVVGTLRADRALLLEIKGEHTREQVLAEMAVVTASGWDDRVFLQSFNPEVLAHVRSIQPARPVGLLVEELHDDPIRVCTELGAVAYNPRHELLRDHPTLVDELRGADIAVLAWTADQPRDWDFLTRIGVDGIITNTPAELLEWQRAPARRLISGSGSGLHDSSQPEHLHDTPEVTP